MKLSAQEEYGLRCLLSMARSGDASLTIPAISESEGLSQPNVAKLLRVLRLGGLVESVRGPGGGYRLARPPEQITVGEALDVLGGRFFTPDFCDRHAGVERICVHVTDCSIRSLLAVVQSALDHVLNRTTLKDLLCSERQARSRISRQIAGLRQTPVVLPVAR